MSKRRTIHQTLCSVAALLVEEAGADAVVICMTRQRRGKTETYVKPFGNYHTCRGIIEYAYGRLCEDEEEEEEEDGDTETEDTEQ